MLVVENAHLATMTSTVPKLNIASEWIFRKADTTSSKY